MIPRNWTKLLLFTISVVFFIITGCLNKDDGGGGTGGRYYGVFIGVSDYRVSSFNLNYADDDAIGISDYFVAGQNWEPGNIIMLLNAQATKTAIRDAIFSTAARMSQDDFFVFYFSGHGTFGPDRPPFDEVDGLDEYLVPHDALRFTFDNDISDDELETWLNAVPGVNVAVIADASWSGGIFKGTERIKFISRPWNEEYGGLPGKDTILKDISRPGCIVLTASDDHESPIESSILGHGVFTFYILEGLAGDANADGNSYFSAEEIYDYSAPRSNAFYGGMHPQMKDLHSGQYPLVFLR